jgi:hypothetical protein
LGIAAHRGTFSGTTVGQNCQKLHLAYREVCCSVQCGDSGPEGYEPRPIHLNFSTERFYSMLTTLFQDLYLHYGVNLPQQRQRWQITPRDCLPTIIQKMFVF